MVSNTTVFWCNSLSTTYCEWQWCQRNGNNHSNSECWMRSCVQETCIGHHSIIVLSTLWDIVFSICSKPNLNSCLEFHLISIEWNCHSTYFESSNYSQSTIHLINVMQKPWSYQSHHTIGNTRPSSNNKV